ncbi:multidrug resistance-associated protein 5 [Tanacetum coccineum]
MDQIKAIIPKAYTYLVEGNPNSWSRAFFDLNSKFASFENGIAESFNRTIVVQRTKPIITMLEDIRLYIMQRLVEMKTKAMNLEDRITPSIRKRLEILKEQQRFWTVIPSGFQELEVRQGDQSFEVNLHLKKCMCKLWELSGIPCVHYVAAYLFLNKEPDEGVDHWYSQERWFEAYQFSIKPIYGSNIWKIQPNKPLLPPIVVRMPGRLRKNRVKAKSENNSQVSRVGKQITCSKCYEKGHNRRNCDKEQLPKLPQMKKQPGRKREPKLNSYASNKGGGRGSRGGRGQESGGLGDASGGRCHASGGLVEASGSLGESNAARFQANTERGKSSGGRGRATGRGGRSGRARGRGGRGQGRGGKSRGRGVITMLVDEEVSILVTNASIL